VRNANRGLWRLCPRIALRRRGASAPPWATGPPPPFRGLHWITRGGVERTSVPGGLPSGQQIPLTPNPLIGIKSEVGVKSEELAVVAVSPRRRERVLSNRDGTAGRGANLMSIPTRGGGRCAPLPRATICSPFRAEERLAVRLSTTRCVQQKRWGTCSARAGRREPKLLIFLDGGNSTGNLWLSARANRSGFAKVIAGLTKPVSPTPSGASPGSLRLPPPSKKGDFPRHLTFAAL
jgi:hypothetical protein